MARFWLATFKLDSPTATQPSAASPPAATEAPAWAIEVLLEGEEIAVLISTVDRAIPPTKFNCRVGFANGSKSCSVWHDRGFPLVDANIKFDRDGLRVQSPCFLHSTELEYETELIVIAGAMLDMAKYPPAAPLTVSYEQSQQAPDYAFPAKWITRRGVSWSTERDDVEAMEPTQLKFTVKSPRLPVLAPIEDGPATPQAIWTGTIDLPKLPPEFVEPAVRASRADAFGVPAFRFEDVEVLGFRIDLDRHGIRDDNALATMIERLNFHLEPADPSDDKTLHSAGTMPFGKKIPDQTRGAMSDFRYRPATRTVMLELLRYGKMKLREDWPPINVNDFQSQHELLVRILVGRVDDDSAQARDPATFVPAIFVDNPWSKALGRSVQGFDKRMADFCVQHEGNPIALRPDGRLPGGKSTPQPLGGISRIDLSGNTGNRPSGRTLLEIDCPFETFDDWDAFVEIDLELAYGTSALAPTRWRQSDFGGVEFRRSFARSAIAKTLKGFRSIQVSPIGGPQLLEQWKAETTWITGTFTVDDGALVAWPDGIVGLKLHAEPSAPESWKTLCKLVGEERISFPSGSWYRMRCSMDLRIDNGFD
jgi:hypothetical protein